VKAAVYQRLGIRMTFQPAANSVQAEWISARPP
jgi:hypothetical protein